MKSNVTMLYGHIETYEERVDHMLRARALQDETGGFPGVHPAGVSSRQQSDAQAACADRLRHAARACRVAPHARQHPARESVLDCDRRRAGADALWFGVDDLDGTVQEEKIYHMAGSRTPEALTTRDIERIIRSAGAHTCRTRHVLQRRAAFAVGFGEQGVVAASQGTVPA
jgi:aminodeoxyfutalosine synthase